MWQRNSSAQSGFTLVELLLAMTILGLVMVSVFNIVQVGMSAYQRSRESMEIYQSGRIALRRVAEELRFALSSNAFWRPQDSIEQLPLEMVMSRFNGPVIEERDPGAITFKGQSEEVVFVRKVTQLQKDPPIDLQECRIFVDRNQNLVLEVVRSLLMVKEASWFFQAVFEVDLSGVVVPGGSGGRTRLRQVGAMGEPPLENFIGDYGVIGERTLIAENIEQIEFRYADGGHWQSSWDSQQLLPVHRISPQSPNYNQQQDMRMVEKGPPLLVEISLTLANGETMITAADVPAGNMHKQGKQGVFEASRGGQPQTRGPERSIRQPINPGENQNQPETPSSSPRAGI